MKKLTALLPLILAITILAAACDNEQTSSVSSTVTTAAITQESTADTAITTSTVSISDTTAPETTPAVTSTVPAVPDSNILPDICSSSYGYYTLNADEKAVYAQLLTAVKGFKESVELKRKLNREALTKVMKILRLEESDLYYLDRDIEINVLADIVTEVFFEYIYTETEVKNLNLAVNEKVKEIFDQIPLNASPISKIKIFHDKIILNCTYDLTSKYADTPYGALVAGEALCEGYARAFALLCNKAGIENLYAIGRYNNSDYDDHIWNMVKLDGDWYNIDLTWDDPPYDGEDKLPDYYIQYNYFMYKNDQSGVNLVVNNSLFAIPETPSSKYNYFIYYGYYAKSYDQAVEILSKQILYALENDRKYVRIRFSTPELYAEARARLLGDSQEIFSETITPADKINKYGSYHFDTLHILQLELYPNE